MPYHGKSKGISRLSFCLGQAKRRKRGTVTISVEDAEDIVRETHEIIRREVARVTMQKIRDKQRMKAKNDIAIKQPGTIIAPHQAIKPLIR
jgi:hypothetical protein